ncbi:M48 family metalloprotease [Thalassospira tepidiphila]|uniref:M48 family metalloprotease n=1 Tax=Thalassospira tepidiphila TaxID=393657 RepID=UPI003AA8321D
MKKLGLAALLGALALTGCVKDMQLLSDSVPTTGKLIDTVSIPVPKSYTLQEIDSAKASVMAKSIGEAPIDELTQYAQGVLDKIIAVAPSGAPTAEIVLIGNSGPGAHAAREGVVFLYHSAFEYLRSEDELAFLIAHEYSHVLLQHTPDNLFSMLRPYLLTAADVAVGTQTNQSDLLRKAGQMYGSDLILRDLLLPNWDRSQERIADHLGLDLMVKAGYQPKGASGYFEVAQEAEEKFDANYQVTRNQLELFLQAQFQPQGQDNALLNHFLSELGNAVDTIQQSLAAKHDDADERAEEIFAYGMREYMPERSNRMIHKEAFDSVVQRNKSTLENYRIAGEVLQSLQRDDSEIDLSDLENDARKAVTGSTANHPYTRWAFAKVRERQGDLSKAAQNIDLIGNGEILALPVEMKRAEILKTLGKVKPAFERVEHVATYYDWPLEAYRFMYPIVKASGNKVRENELLIGCVTRYPQQRAMCAGQSVAGQMVGM